MHKGQIEVVVFNARHVGLDIAFRVEQGSGSGPLPPAAAIRIVPATKTSGEIGTTATGFCSRRGNRIGVHRNGVRKF
jgi:hypothetical protein